MRTRDAVIYGLALVISTTILGHYFYHSKVRRDTIDVLGSATRRYNSDIVKWNVTVSRIIEENDMKSGYALIQKDLNYILAYLKSDGFTDQEITIKPIAIEERKVPIPMGKYDTVQQYRHQGYIFRQQFFVISKNIPKVEKLALNSSFIIEKGIILDCSNLDYYFSTLPDIKRELVAEATKDADARAKSIAKTAHVSINRLIRADTGTFQINEPYANEVSYGGTFNTSTREKDISITLNATYTLK